MITGTRVFSVLLNGLVCVGLLGLVVPPYSLAKDKGGQQEVGDDLREEADDEDDDRDDQGGKDRLERCLRALSEGKKVPKKCPQGGSSSGIAKGDFNGDGFADLAVGVPGEDTPASEPDAGAVIVIYGFGSGLTATTAGIPASQFWSQNAAGVAGISEAGDGFGSALAAGDFNDDGFSDLAVGAPFDDNEFANRSGKVIVIYGSPNGLTATDSTVPSSQSFDVLDFDPLFALFNEEFGLALAWGDFDGDGVGDLAIGSPGFGQASLSSVGAVFVLFGSPNGGLSAARGQFWDQASVGVPGTNRPGDSFGAALAGGDFNGDDVTDLAIGIPGKNVPGTSTQGGGTIQNAGAVLVLFGSANVGLTSTGNRLFDETILSLVSTQFAGLLAQAGHRFGNALAAGDFDGDGRDDLAMSAASRNIGQLAQAGGVWVKFGPLPIGGQQQFWDQSRIFPGSTTINERDGDGTPTEAGDFFGAALAAGDFNADGRDDLAIGAPFEDVLVQRTATSFETVADAGAVNVIYGSTTGLSLTGRAPQFWNQQSINIEDDAEAGDRFGASLTAWNFGRNGTRQLCNPITHRCDTFSVPIADLAIGVPRENVGTIVDAGAVNVIYGSVSFDGLTFSNDQLWTQDSPGVPGGPEAGDHFGEALY